MLRAPKRVCRFCGKLFAGKPKRKFCSQKCMGNAYRRRDAKCLHCQTPLRFSKNRFCSRKCAWANPERHRRASEQMRELRREPGMVAKICDHLKLRNPLYLQTEPQRLLAAKLGWPMELKVLTGQKRGHGIPAFYKIDIGNEAVKVAVEVDGDTHRQEKTKAEDQKKTKFLESQGWVVFRFWNREILENFYEVYQRIQSAVLERMAA